MTRDELLKELQENECLDLVKIYQNDRHRHFYTIIEELYEIREEHGLSTRISQFKTEIEKLAQDIDSANVTPVQFKTLTQALDLNQRTQKVARFIQTKDNHLTFSKPVDLVMYGDSITEWGPWHDALDFVRVANRGLAGDTTAGMIQRLETTTVCQPKLICMMAGINDLAQGYSVEEIIENYSKMLRYWRELEIDVWVQSTLYVGERLSELNPKVTSLNQQLEQLCAEFGTKFINLNLTICPQGYLPLICSADDLHLNSYAYGKWISQITPLLEIRLTSKC